MYYCDFDFTDPDPGFTYGIKRMACLTDPSEYSAIEGAFTHNSIEETTRAFIITDD
jgi:hypothetical protein